jgi:hypothetical protein
MEGRIIASPGMALAEGGLKAAPIHGNPEKGCGNEGSEDLIEWPVLADIPEGLRMMEGQ